MGPFALSVPGYALGVHSRKRPKRPFAVQQEEESPAPEVETAFKPQKSSLPPNSINPLSHPPDVLHQLALAGLSPDDELPSTFHPSFPHARLPTGRKKSRGSTSRRGINGTESGTETEATSRSTRRDREVERKQHTARVHHLNTMTAIMHRCLKEGDIDRAKRAFSLLIRSRNVDLRIDSLWAIGSEILMRDGESSRYSTVPPQSLMHQDYGEPHEERVRPPKRWGSAANIDVVKTYFENLISQYPHDVARQLLNAGKETRGDGRLADAMDFWPALYSIEIYNLDAEYQTAKHHVYLEYGAPPTPSSSRGSSPGARIKEDPDADDMDIDSSFHSGVMEQNDDEDEHEDRHRAIDTLRSETRRGALEIATRMDTTMENQPYVKHAELLRLRGHMSLFIADLYLPSRVTERSRARNSPMGKTRKLSLQGVELRASARRPEEHVALGKYRQEQDRARGFFRRSLANEGVLEEWIVGLLNQEDGEGN
ncbi:hypothetical protein F5Y18DRAFT_214420 [Xylariaceae sp. FL1019]|nr:hypothetical protein F5Y18DRAFT_214420 [Xylariaceae sp. FL1019]